ncbi:GFA family protein [Marivivens sp. LCG002]|uniref:GFA family protein n=1 Tax=Marivivens sp. LCG002 TaxID=3051171 RepID=UPI002555D4BD|nr:GFA family protein [Marivivens sp. LCG002]WIV50686.1 GFA family protein [Marivivens sp. LCG002]
MMEVECHCGAVRITLLEPSETVTSCNCSICRRYGALWSYGTLETIKVAAPPGGLEEYAWGEKGLAFVRCRGCGCVTHWESRSAEYPDRIAANMRNASPEDLLKLGVRHFDGAETWTYLD